MVEQSGSVFFEFEHQVVWKRCFKKLNLNSKWVGQGSEEIITESQLSVVQKLKYSIVLHIYISSQ